LKKSQSPGEKRICGPERNRNFRKCRPPLSPGPIFTRPPPHFVGAGTAGPNTIFCVYLKPTPWSPVSISPQWADFSPRFTPPPVRLPPTWRTKTHPFAQKVFPHFFPSHSQRHSMPSDAYPPPPDVPPPHEILAKNILPGHRWKAHIRFFPYPANPSPYRAVPFAHPDRVTSHCFVFQTKGPPTP